MKLTDFFEKPPAKDKKEAKDDDKEKTAKGHASHAHQSQENHPEHHEAHHRTHQEGHKTEPEQKEHNPANHIKDVPKHDSPEEIIIDKRANRNDSISWTQKYRPSTSKDLCGIDSSVEKIKDYIARYKPGMKALLINGPPGCGKTSSVYAIANDLKLEVFELNASDDRNKDSIISTAGSAMQQGSLFGTRKIILLEEIDGISESEDRGGVTELVNLIPKSRYPVIMTANDPWDRKFSNLRAKSEIVTFNTPTYISLTKAMERICESEGITASKDILTAIARRNGGDFRGAINDLQIMSSGRKELDEKDLDLLGDRKKTESIMNALMRIMKTLDPGIALSAFDDVDENIDEQILWLEENIASEYTEKDDLKEAYDRLSKADVFRGRITRWQHWDFLVYVSALTTAGIALSKKEKYQKFVSYKPTTRILKIWLANQSNARKKSISQKIASKIHSSSKEVYSDFDYYRMLFSNSYLTEPLTRFFELDPEDVSLLTRK